MGKIVRVLVVFLVTTILLGADVQLYDEYVLGEIYKHQAVAKTMTIVGFMVLVHILTFMILLRAFNKADKYSIWGLLLIASSFPSCQYSQYAQSNQKTLYTSDCGKTWSLIKTGQSIPKCTVPPCACEYVVRVPDYPMDGDTKFRVSFSEKVVANIEMSYSYEITDPLLFITEAKYLAKANTSASDSTNGLIYERVENMVIDARLKETSRNVFNKEDIIEYDHNSIEELLLNKLNTELANKGVRVFNFSFVPIFDEQTRNAIDAVTAYTIYKSKGLEDIGKAILVSRSGATQITVSK